jgi:hypothetical protein
LKLDHFIVNEIGITAIALKNINLKEEAPNASVNFSEISKMCSERQKTMSTKQKEKFEDMENVDKAPYRREMET